jgi:phage I-like protein
MAHYEARGADVPIDLEHLSTDDTAPNYDPDARGWAKLQLRNGELWAVGISWNADGAARVSEKRQRYVSPYFGWEETSDGQRRIVELVNFAICANPATHNPPALIAASKGARTAPSRTARRVRAVPVTSTLHLPPHLAARF